MKPPWLRAEVLEHIGSFILWPGCFVLGAISALMMLKLGKAVINNDVLIQISFISV